MPSVFRNPDFALKYLNAARTHRMGEDFLQFPERLIEFNNDMQLIDIVVPQNYNRIGTTLWDAAIVLVEYLSKILPQIDLTDKNICELGAGCCVATIYLHLTDQNKSNCLIIQELEEIIPHCKESITRNIKCVNDMANIRFIGSSWNDDCIHLLRNELNNNKNNSNRFDLLVMSDVTYKEEDFSTLIDTIVGLTDDTTRIVIAYEQRRKDLKSFFEALLQRLYEKGRVEEWCTEYIIEPPPDKPVQDIQESSKAKYNNNDANVAANVNLKHRPIALFRVHDYQVSPFL